MEMELMLESSSKQKSGLKLAAADRDDVLSLHQLQILWTVTCLKRYLRSGQCFRPKANSWPHTWQVKLLVDCVQYLDQGMSCAMFPECGSGGSFNFPQAWVRS